MNATLSRATVFAAAIWCLGLVEARHTSVAHAEIQSFTNSGWFRINNLAGNAGFGRYMADPPVFHEGEVHSPFPGWDDNMIWDWEFEVTAPSTPVADNPLVGVQPTLSQSVVTAMDDNGNVVGTLGLLGTGELFFDVTADATLADDSWSSQVYTQYRIDEMYEITAQTGIYEDLIKVGDWSTHVQGRSARPLSQGVSIGDAAVGAIAGATSTFVIEGQYDFASDAPPAPTLQTVVSPGSFTDTEAPDVGDTTGVPSYRFQQVYAASDFATLGDGPYMITRIDWRADGAVSGPIDYPSDRFLMKFATTDYSPVVSGETMDLDLTFANNINGNEVTVIDGPITLTTSSESLSDDGPNQFDYGVDLETPYLYDPTQGNLLMDLTVINADAPLLIDFIFAPSDTTRFMWTGTLGPDSELGTAGQSGGHVLQFTIASELNPFDCNGDGIVDVSDLNCTTADALGDAVAAAGLTRGDIDGDGNVAFSDFLILSNNFTQTGNYTDGDLDLDGEVQFGDFLILAQNFAGDVQQASVPEPNAAWTFMIGVLCLLRSPLRRR